MRFIIINGPMGVGKTTVGGYIADTHSGTAFIDGDWCLDIHPFVGNTETRRMAVDNILHMADNYRKCSVCNMIVLSWTIDDRTIMQELTDGILAVGLEPVSVTLICGREALTDRWRNDRICKWRSDDWLQVSIKSLDLFCSLGNCIDTTGLSVSEVAEQVMNGCYRLYP